MTTDLTKVTSALIKMKASVTASTGGSTRRCSYSLTFGFPKKIQKCLRRCRGIPRPRVCYPCRKNKFVRLCNKVARHLRGLDACNEDAINEAITTIAEGMDITVTSQIIMTVKYVLRRGARRGSSKSTISVSAMASVLAMNAPLPSKPLSQANAKVCAKIVAAVKSAIRRKCRKGPFTKITAKAVVRATIKAAYRKYPKCKVPKKVMFAHVCAGVTTSSNAVSPQALPKTCTTMIAKMKLKATVRVPKNLRPVVQEATARAMVKVAVLAKQGRAPETPTALRATVKACIKTCLLYTSPSPRDS